MNRNTKQGGIMRGLGAFFGHIVRAIRTDVTPSSGPASTVNQTVEEERHAGFTLRRTTIDEVEVHNTRDEEEN